MEPPPTVDLCEMRNACLRCDKGEKKITWHEDGRGLATDSVDPVHLGMYDR